MGPDVPGRRPPRPSVSPPPRRAPRPPHALDADAVGHLQREVGNRAVADLIVQRETKRGQKPPLKVGGGRAAAVGRPGQVDRPRRTAGRGPRRVQEPGDDDRRRRRVDPGARHPRLRRPARRAGATELAEERRVLREERHRGAVRERQGVRRVARQVRADRPLAGVLPGQRALRGRVDHEPDPAGRQGQATEARSRRGVQAHVAVAGGRAHAGRRRRCSPSSARPNRTPRSTSWTR